MSAFPEKLVILTCQEIDGNDDVEDQYIVQAFPDLITAWSWCQMKSLSITGYDLVYLVDETGVHRHESAGPGTELYLMGLQEHGYRDCLDYHAVICSGYQGEVLR